MKRFSMIAMIAVGLATGTAHAQDASVDAYGGQGQAPAVLGVEETGVVDTTAGTVGGEADTTGVAGVQGGAPAASTSTPTAAPTAAEAVPSGSLPFTGLDIALIALGGVALLGLGFAMRRFTAARPLAD